MICRNVTITSTCDEIGNKLIEKDAAMQRANPLDTKALLIAKIRGTGGRDRQVGKSPKRDKIDNMEDKKDQNLQKSFVCQQRCHITENCLSTQCGDPPKTAHTAAKDLTETTLSQTSLINKY